MKILKIVFLIAASISIFISCGKSSDNLAKSIPADAQSVISINMDELVKKSNYNIFENQTVKRGFNIAKAMLKNEKAVSLIEDFEKNPNAFGVTLNKDIYLFSSGSYFGLILPVNDPEKLKETIMNFNVAEKSDIKTEKGITSLLLGESLNMAWDKHKFILVGTFNIGQDSTHLSSTELINLDTKKSILSDKNYAKFAKDQDKQDISIYYSAQMYRSLSSNLTKLNMATTTNPIEKFNASNQDMQNGFEKLSQEMKGVSIGTFVSFEAGKINTHSQFYFATAEDESRYKNWMKQTTGELSSKYLQYISQSPILTFASNIKGSGYFNLLSKLGFANGFENELRGSGIDLKSLLESVQGNILFVLNGLSVSQNGQKLNDMDAMLAMKDNSPKIKINVSLFAELSKDNSIQSFIDSLIAKKPSDAIKKTGEGQYSIKDSDLEGFFGVKDNTFYFTTESGQIASLGKEVNSSYYKNAKGNSAFLYCDIRPLKKYAMDYFSMRASSQDVEYKGLIDNGLSLVETVDGFVKPDLTNEVNLNFTNKKDNSLATLCQFLDKLLTTLGAQRGI